MAENNSNDEISKTVIQKWRVHADKIQLDANKIILGQEKEREINQI